MIFLINLIIFVALFKSANSSRYNLRNLQTERNLDTMYQQPCPFWLRNTCNFTEFTCKWPHHKDNMSLCILWTKGNCIGTTGNSCRFRHYYNEYDKSNQPPVNPLNRQVNRLQEISNLQFSSPLVTRVHKLKHQKRKVEIDIETGKRRSFIETTEEEIIDITGVSTPHPKNKENRPVDADKRRSSERLLKKRLSLDSSPQEKTTASAPPPPPPSELVATPAFRTIYSDGYCHGCSREFKGVRGLKSHLASSRTKCSKENIPLASTTTTTSEISPVSMDESIILID